MQIEPIKPVSHTFVIEMRNKTNLWINAKQAAVVDKAWQDRMPVEVNGSTINTVDIVGLWPIHVWYDNHPEDRPPTAAPLDEQIMLDEVIEDSEKNKLWRVALGRNLKLLHKGERPVWSVKDGELVKVDLRYDPTPRTSMKAEWVKKSVTKSEFAKKYALRPGYFLLHVDGERYEIGLTHTLDHPMATDMYPCNAKEVEILERAANRD